MVDNGAMPSLPSFDTQLLAPAQVAELLGVSVAEVMNLVSERELRGMRVGSPPQWRIESDSVSEYLDDQTEKARRMALWRGSQAASFPELWGSRSD